MKRLDFTRTTNEKAETFFEMVYDAITQGPRGFNGVEETRPIGKVLDKMEAIGKPRTVSTSQGDRESYTLSAEGGNVLLEEREYKLVVESVRAVRWTGQGARNATAMLDWIDAAPAHLTEMVDQSARV